MATGFRQAPDSVFFSSVIGADGPPGVDGCSDGGGCHGDGGHGASEW